MRIAIIGYGPTGYAAAEYLKQLRIPATIYVPDTKVSKQPENTYAKELEISKSPKLSRADVKSLAARSKEIYGNVDYLNFCGLEIPQKGGLAYCWGANLAKDSTIYRHTFSPEWSEAFAFIDKIVPALSPDIESIPGSSRHLRQTLSFYNSTLAVYPNCTQCLSCHLNCECIWGAEIPISSSHNWLNRSVSSLQLDCKGGCVVESIDHNGLAHSEAYDLVILAAGAIGSYRIVKNSIKTDHASKMYNRIKHHLLTTRICFAPLFPHRKKTLSMSLFDCFVDLQDYQSYVNFFPLRGALNAIPSQAGLLKLGSRVVSIFCPPLVQKFVKRFSEALAHLFLSRFYIANFYHDGCFSSSYISFDVLSKKITVQGGFRSDVEKTILKGGKSWQVFLEFLKRGIFVSPLPFVFHPAGADLHSYGSLTADIKRADTPELFQSKSVLIVDSSSSDYSPLENPTYYFMARSIVLLREHLSRFHGKG